MAEVAQRASRPDLLAPRSFVAPEFASVVLTLDQLRAHKSALKTADLLPSLIDGRAIVRANAARSLSLVAALSAADAQTAAVALRDSDAGVRAAVATSLANVQHPEILLETLLDAGADPSAAVAAAVVATLAVWGEKALSAVPQLLNRSSDWFDSRAAEALAQLGANLMPTLHAALASGDPVREGNVRSVLSRLEESAIQPSLKVIAGHLDSGADLMRRCIAQRLRALLRRTQTVSRDPIVFPIEGFETDLLSPEQLKGAKKALSRQLLFQCLSDGRLAVRANALSALGIHGSLDEGELRAVCVFLRDESASVRAAAARALQQASDPAIVLQPLMRASIDADASVRHDAAEAIKSLGSAGLQALIAALDVDPDIADAQIVSHIVAHGSAASPLLHKALRSLSAEVRGNALAAVISLGTAALLEAQPVITPLARDISPHVASMARQALGILARKAKPQHQEARLLPLDEFADQLVDDAALKKVGKQLQADALLALCRDGRPFVRANAWKGLASLGALSPEATLLAAVACRDGEAHVRREACVALRQIPNDLIGVGVTALAMASRDADKTVAQAARQAVFHHGKKAVPHLIELFGAREAQISDPAVHLAAALETDAAAEVVAALDAALPTTRENAVIALAEMGGKPLEDALGAIVRRFADSHDGARLQAIDAVGRMKPAAWKKQANLADLLKHMWREDANRAVRNAAGHLFARLAIA